MMEVTEVRISPAKGGKVRAFASVVFDDCFIVNDLRVVEGREGQVFVSMPVRKTRNGQMRDIAHPLDSKTRELIEQRVIEEYQTAVSNRVVPDPATQGAGGKEARGAVLDRLSARLFNEEFWIADAPSQPGDDGE
jgi:stage V sporulation protein G